MAIEELKPCPFCGMHDGDHDKSYPHPRAQLEQAQSSAVVAAAPVVIDGDIARYSVNQLNPYAGSGSPAENWRRGFMGQRLLGAPTSAAEKIYKEGQAARKVADQSSAQPAPAVSDGVCKACSNTGIVDDGYLTHSEGGIEYEHPIKCMKDCPECARKAGAGQAVTFQNRVQPWMMECFGEAISNDLGERNHRFLEEAIELVQSNGCTQSEAHQLVDYVFGRPVGEPQQEVGGVMVTLAALCLAAKLDMHEAGEIELARISSPETVLKIRAKQAAKPKHSPLPQHVDAPAAVPQGWKLVPAEPTEAMLNAARDWSVKKYGIGVGNDGAIGCYGAMFAAAPTPPAAPAMGAAHACHQCGLPVSKNPHPDAGKPDRVLEVNTQTVCIPCLTSNRHRWAERAAKAESNARRWRKLCAMLDAAAEEGGEFPCAVHEAFQMGGEATCDAIDAAMAKEKP